MKNLFIAITGHRPQKLPWGSNEKLKSCKNFKKDFNLFMKKLLINNNIYFICGMALGIDIITAEIIIKLKKKHSNIFLECAIPCLNQTKFWNAIDKERYNKILEKSDEITFISNKTYFKGCMQKRNEYIINKSNLLLAAFNGENGGTKNTIDYAIRKGVKIKIFDINKY